MAASQKQPIASGNGGGGEPMRAVTAPQRDFTLDEQALIKLRRAADMRLRLMEALRWSWWTTWRVLAKYINPRLARFLETAISASGRGRQKNQAILNSTGTTSANRFAAGLLSGTASPARPWFRLAPGDEGLADNQAVKQWLSDVEKVMMKVFRQSNFYTSLATVYELLGVFGTAAMLIYDDYEDVIRCYVPAIGEFYLANDGRLECTTFYRKYASTIAELMTRFPRATFSNSVMSAIENNQIDKEIIVCHGIELNDSRIDGMRGHAGMLYREIYWEHGQAEHLVLEVSGYREKPFCGVRWNVTANDPYGKGPGEDAIGDIIQIQVQEREKSKAIQKVVNPPLVADARLKNEPATSVAGGVTYIPAGTAADGFRSLYEIRPDIQAIGADIKSAEARVKTTFFEDLFLMISELDTVRSATEIAERKEEKMLMLGPALERTHVELLAVAVERVYAICTRSGILPAAPVEMHGQFLTAEFVSTLAQAQKAVATTAIERLAAFVGNLTAGQEAPRVPDDPRDKIDFDEMIDVYSDAIGGPPKLIVSDQKVAAMRAARSQQAQQAAATQQLQGAAAGAATLSKVDVGGGQTAVQRMLGTGP